MPNKKFWQFNITENEKVGELLIYGPISSNSWWGDEVTPLQFKADLDALGDITELNVYINSDGGDVFAGQAIHSMIKRHAAKVIVHVDGLAASIASVIAMAGDIVHMPSNSMMMIHNPMTIAFGNSGEFRKIADTLDKIRESSIAVYQEKSGLDEKKIIKLMDDETWLTAEDAFILGFADEIDEKKQIAASLEGKFVLINGLKMDLTRYRNPPKIEETKPPPEVPEIPKQQPVNSDELFLYQKSIEIKQKKFKEVC